MKTQEEIEQLAKKQKGCSKEYCDSIDEQYGYLNGYIDGYSKCQEDMADNKYTEEDMIKAILFGMQKGLNVGKVDETDNDWVNNYVNSLNKQD